MGVGIYVIDDSSNSETELKILELKGRYKNIFYEKNIENLGHDKNFFKTINYPKTDYVWYLGDSIYIDRGGISEVLNLISLSFPDFIFVNHYLDSNNQDLNKMNSMEFIKKMTWYLTLTSATVYSRKSIDCLSEIELTENIWKNFPQLGAILNFFSKSDVKFNWVEKKFLIRNLNKNSSYWSASFINVFVIDWINLINYFAELFNESDKVDVIKSHAKNTGLFSFKNLLKFRSLEAFDFNILNKYFKEINLASPNGVVLFYVVLIFPVFIIKLFMMFNRFIKRLIKGRQGSSA